MSNDSTPQPYSEKMLRSGTNKDGGTAIGQTRYSSRVMKAPVMPLPSILRTRVKPCGHKFRHRQRVIGDVILSHLVIRYHNFTKSPLKHTQLLLT